MEMHPNNINNIDREVIQNVGEEQIDFKGFKKYYSDKAKLYEKKNRELIELKDNVEGLFKSLREIKSLEFEPLENSFILNVEEFLDTLNNEFIENLPKNEEELEDVEYDNMKDLLFNFYDTYYRYEKQTNKISKEINDLRDKASKGFERTNREIKTIKEKMEKFDKEIRSYSHPNLDSKDKVHPMFEASREEFNTMKEKAKIYSDNYNEIYALIFDYRTQEIEFKSALEKLITKSQRLRSMYFNEIKHNRDYKIGFEELKINSDMALSDKKDILSNKWNRYQIELSGEDEEQNKKNIIEYFKNIKRHLEIIMREAVDDKDIPTHGVGVFEFKNYFF